MSELKDTGRGPLRPTRRAALAAGAVGAAGVSLVALSRRGLRARNVDTAAMPRLVAPRRPGPSAHLVPNVPVITHTGREALFYDDLVQDRIVAIHFMSVRGDEVYPVVDNLVRLQRVLGRRFGRDLFLRSVTTDPEHDTPEVLAAFAAEKGIGPGWDLVTGGERELAFLRSFLFVRRPFPTAAPMQGVHGPCCSVGLVRYGNEQRCRWASFPAKTTPEFIATRFTWPGFRSADAPRLG